MVPVSELPQPFQRGDSAPHIQQRALAVGVFGVVGWCELEKWGEIVLMCMGNNAVGRIHKEKEMIGVSRDITAAFFRYCSDYEIGPMSLMVRTFGDIGAGFLTRGSDVEIQRLDLRLNMTHVDLMQRWETSSSITHVIQRIAREPGAEFLRMSKIAMPGIGAKKGDRVDTKDKTETNSKPYARAGSTRYY